MAGPWKYDPVAYFFLEAVETFLRQPGRAGVALDLFDRLALARTKNQEGDNSKETTLRRMSWCCYMVGDIILELLEHPPSMTPPHLRPPMTAVTFEAMDRVLHEVDQVALVDHTEYVMGDDEAKRKAAQLWADKSKRLMEASRRGLHVVRASEDYVKEGIPDSAALVGERFLEFLTALDRTRDDLVMIAEALVEVRG